LIEDLQGVLPGPDLQAGDIDEGMREQGFPLIFLGRELDPEFFLPRQAAEPVAE
jgi:hypothetical protein